MQGWQFFSCTCIYKKHNEHKCEFIVKCALKASKVTDCSAAATFQVCMHAVKETATYES